MTTSRNSGHTSKYSGPGKYVTYCPLCLQINDADRMRAMHAITPGCRSMVCKNNPDHPRWEVKW